MTVSIRSSPKAVDGLPPLLRVVVGPRVDARSLGSILESHYAFHRATIGRIVHISVSLLASSGNLLRALGKPCFMRDGRRSSPQYMIASSHFAPPLIENEGEPHADLIGLTSVSPSEVGERNSPRVARGYLRRRTHASRLQCEDSAAFSGSESTVSEALRNDGSKGLVSGCVSMGSDTTESKDSLQQEVGGGRSRSTTSCSSAECTLGEVVRTCRDARDPSTS